MAQLIDMVDINYEKDLEVETFKLEAVVAVILWRLDLQLPM